MDSDLSSYLARLEGVVIGTVAAVLFCFQPASIGGIYGADGVASARYPSGVNHILEAV